MLLSAENQALLTDLWREILYGVRYPSTGRVRIDGVSYHYSGDFDRLQALAGQTWSPTAGTRLERFTRLTDGLYAACAANDENALAWSISEANAICAEVGCGVD